MIIDELFNILFAEFESPVEKMFQIRRPEKTKTGYGSPWEGMFSVLPKKKVKMSIIISGWIIAHMKPRTVCLYFILMSRHVKK
ncbi:MAG: hypothetical protein WDN75_03325 [Bacteroidota bacterium]